VGGSMLRETFCVSEGYFWGVDAGWVSLVDRVVCVKKTHPPYSINKHGDYTNSRWLPPTHDGWEGLETAKL
jgi:hypothetical protein